MSVGYDWVQEQLNSVPNSSSTKKTGVSGTTQVWVNNNNTYDSYGSYGGYSAKGVHGAPQTLSKDEITQEVLSLASSNPAAYMGVAQNLYKMGALYSMRYATNLNSVATAIGRAVDVYAYGKKEVPFSSWLDQTANSPTNLRALMKAQGVGGGAYTGPVTTTSVQITDATTAEGLLQKFSQDMLGRNLSKDEVAKYTQQLNKQEKANPQVTYSDGHGASQSQSTKTAPDKQQILHNIISQNSDYIPNQIDTTVMDQFLNRIKSGQDIING